MFETMDFRFMIENLGNAVIVTDDKLHLLYLNPCAESMFELSARRVQGEKIQTLFAGASSFIKALKHGLDTGSQFTIREMALPLPVTGHTITVDCNVTLVANKQKQTRLLVELQQVDRMIRIAREEGLLAQQTAIKVLARGLAHEVKNPLGGLRGAAQLLERQLPSEDLKEYTKIIIEEADRLQKLVDHMLGSNRLPNKTEINIHEILEHVRQLSMVESNHDLFIDRDYDPSIPNIIADRDQLIQVLLNLTKNARQALKDHGTIKYKTRTLRQFTIGHKRYRHVVKIEIIDNGPGIPEDMQQQIFYPMVTTRPEGTGLGLAIAQTLIGQHGGLIQCQSQPGKTVFSILIPINFYPEEQT